MREREFYANLISAGHQSNHYQEKPARTELLMDLAKMSGEISAMEHTRAAKQDGSRDIDIPCMTQGRKNHATSSKSIGKHTKSNQKGEELPFYEVRNIIYRPGGEFYLLSVAWFTCHIFGKVM